MLTHGWQKIRGFTELAENFPDPIGMGSKLSLMSVICAEFGCSLLLIAGLFTRIATLPLAITMIVALTVIHANDPWQKKELAACYLAVYAVIMRAVCQNIRDFQMRVLAAYDVSLHSAPRNS